LSVPLLVAAAREELGARRRRLPAARALQLAGEVLAVSAGLKPALLYDCSAAGLPELRRYLARVKEAGLALRRLHLLGMEGSVLLLHPRLARQRLEAALRARPAPFMDVSAGRLCPALCGPVEAETIKGHLAALLAHLGAAEATSAGPVSSSEVVPEGWNLCTVVGVLLGYPASYTFTTEESTENCLALTPLRVFTVQASCPRIRDGHRVQIYSFSIPERLCTELKEVLDAWCHELREAFSAQSDFVDLHIANEVVSLPVVSL
ncbi:CA074 protein, partial [Brachypteracias leptosomus]|nr:CA074 protein [Brachypteracias leptosomus]